MTGARASGFFATFASPSRPPRGTENCVAPSPFQQKLFWAALTALAFVALGAVTVLVGGLFLRGISFLQPVLIPVAIAGILAYLLEPVVQWLEGKKLGRTKAVVIVFIAFTLGIAGIFVWVAPIVWKQGNTFVNDLPRYTEQAKGLFDSTIQEIEKLRDRVVLKSKTDEGGETGGAGGYLDRAIEDALGEAQKQLPGAALAFGGFLQRSVGGFLGVFGMMLSLVLVPVFLFFFLKEGPSISSNWSNYLPMRASPLKSEIVSLLSEINDYLINFFRGQLLVSMIDGAITAILLLVLGLDFALLIGLLVAILGLIPYAGVFISWIPAVIIAAAQFGDWLHPLLVTLIFLGVNNLDGIFIAPKIVGESVGLHPLTVILSVLAWSIILGGLLGALLAVPLTATLKVLLKRYFWDKPAVGHDPAPG
jgi:predicted PurR-regulated permease PerM